MSLLIDPQILTNQQIPLIPGMFHSFFYQAQQLIHNASNGLDMQAIAFRTKNLDISNPDTLIAGTEKYSHSLENTSLDTFWSRLFGNFENQKKYLIFKNLTDILLPQRGRDLSRLSLGLRFPLSNESDSQQLEVSFWIKLCLQIAGDKATIPTIFWTTEQADKQFVFIFFRQPSTKCFAQLIDPTFEYDSISPLDEDGIKNIDQAADKLPPEYRNLLEQKDIIVRDFLDRLQ